MKLTPSQQRVYDLRHSQDPPPSWNEIARRLGCTKGAASGMYSTALRRLAKPEPKHRRVRADAVEMRNPALVPEVVDLASDPFETVKAMARKLEMPDTTVHDLMKRMKTRYEPVIQEAKEVKSEVLRDLFSTNARRVLESVTDEDIAKAGLRDKAVAAGIYTDKTLLLQGQPTQVMSVKELQSLEELSKMMVAEAKRRGTRMLPPKPPSSAGPDPTE